MPARCGQDWFKHQGLSTTDLGFFFILKGGDGGRYSVRISSHFILMLLVNMLPSDFVDYSKIVL